LGKIHPPNAKCSSIISDKKKRKAGNEGKKGSKKDLLLKKSRPLPFLSPKEMGNTLLSSERGKELKERKGKRR